MTSERRATTIATTISANDRAGTSAGVEGRASRMAAAGRDGEATAGRVLSRLAAKLGRDGFERYFRDQTRLSVEGRRVDVTVPTGFVAEFIDKRFGLAVREAAGEELAAGRPDEIEVRFRVDGSAFGSPPHAPHAATSSDRPSTGSASSADRPGDPLATDPSPRPRTAGGRWHRGPWGSRGLPVRRRLEEMVVGESNGLGYKAAERLAEMGAPVPFSTLFLHGPCGIGKTLLLQGIAARARERCPGTSAVYITAETFTNEYIAAVRAGALDSFRAAYRGIQLLCIDDVQFFARKQGTQNELLHTLDAISLMGSRVALACDESPRRIRDLSPQLASRFTAGMVVGLSPPEPALRESIVHTLARRRGIDLDPAAVRLIAHHQAGAGSLGPTVRDLEGDLTRVEALAMASPHLIGAGGVVGLNLARAALGLEDTSAPGTVRKPIRPDLIISTVCAALQVELPELMGRGRHPRVVLARSASAWLARQLTTMSFPEIARALGRPNHSTIVTACQRLDRQIRSRAAVPAARHHSGSDLTPQSVDELVEQLRAEILRRA